MCKTFSVFVRAQCCRSTTATNLKKLTDLMNSDEKLSAEFMVSLCRSWSILAGIFAGSAPSYTRQLEG
jgi:hypothetical protein